MSKRLITIFGGSGFIGRTLVQRLAADGHRIRVAIRHPNQALTLKTLGSVGQIQLAQANLRHPDSVAAAVAGADTVINLVGVLTESGHQTFDAINRDGAETLARAAKAAGVGRLIHISALNCDANPESAYAKSKALGETQVKTVFPEATILRPSVVFGPDDRFFNRFASTARMLALAPAVPLFAAESRLQPVYVGDLAEAIRLALINPETIGQTLDIGGPRDYSMRELWSFTLKEIGMKKPLVAVPMGLARVMAGVLGVLPCAPITSDQLRLLEKDNVVEPGCNGLDRLGIQPTSIEAVVPHYLLRFRPGGQFARNLP